MNNWQEQQLANLRDQAYQANPLRHQHDIQEVSSSSNAHANRPGPETDPLRYNIHLTRNDIHVRQEENSELRRRQEEVEERVREEMNKNNVTQHDMKRLFDEMMQQRDAMQTWSSHVENKFVDDSTSDEDMRKKIDTLAKEMVKMQDIVTRTLERSEARTDEISKKTIEHMKAINESKIEQKALVTAEEKPQETLERREREVEFRRKIEIN